MISYEVVLTLSIAPNLLLNSSLNIEKINYQQQELSFFYILWPNAKIFYISILAETNRTPFDLPEAEAEIVAGYNVEYASIIFALFFLGEYCNMIVMSYFLILLYFGG
jgi:NADH-quinone oxidoreductase subunit H